MKKTVKRILRTISILIGLVVFGALIFLINFLHATRSMTPDDTGMINDLGWYIKDRFVNVYILRGKTGYLMTDAGIWKKNSLRSLIN